MAFKIGPVSPKAHGAWMGSAAGASIAGTIVSLLQDYVSHGPLSSSLVSVIYMAVPAVTAFLGSYVAPVFPASMISQARSLAGQGAPPGWPAVPAPPAYSSKAGQL